MKNDPFETQNIADDYPEITRKLFEKLNNWERTLTQPRWYDSKNWKHWAKEQLNNYKF